MSNGVEKALDKEKKAREAAKVKRDQGPKADMRQERKKNMVKAFNKKNPRGVKPRIAKVAGDVIEKRSARTRPEAIAKAQRFVKNNPEFKRNNQSILTERGYEDLPPLPKDREEKMYPIGKAKGGTVRLKSGGPVVDSYDYS